MRVKVESSLESYLRVKPSSPQSPRGFYLAQPAYNTARKNQNTSAIEPKNQYVFYLTKVLLQYRIKGLHVKYGGNQSFTLASRL